MNFRRGAASLLALALFSVGAMAQSSESAPVENVDIVKLPDNVLALINDKRTAQELSEDELRTRARAVRKVLGSDGLPADVRDQLQALMESDQAEFKTRRNPKQKGAAKAEEQPVQEAAPEPKIEPKQEEQPVQEAAPQQDVAPQPKVEAVAEMPSDVLELLNDRRDLSEFTPEELTLRARKSRQLAGDESLPKKVRRQLNEISKLSRQALAKSQEEAEQSQQEAAPKKPKLEPKVVEEQPVDVKVVEPVTPAVPAVDKIEVQELDGNKGDPEAEKKALAFLLDEKSADSLSDDELRTRLDAIRDLMAENELSVKTERALRKKLSTERNILRERIAKAKAEEEAKVAAIELKKQADVEAAAPSVGTDEANADSNSGLAKKKKNKKFNIDLNILITPETPRRVVLRDRRASEELEESELRQRIKIYRDVEADEAYESFAPEERSYWRETIRRDRQRLRRDLEVGRRERVEELNNKKNVYRFTIDDEQDVASNDGDAEDVFAAEVEDEDIERVLVAPPKKKPLKRYTLEDIEAKPQVRNSLTRIEVDTIRFGFNEAFVREEEVDSLDQIASVIERVLTKYPREVFLIEGHTDAVGSDIYNAKLSKGRAEAVKKALTSFYIIPAKNLKTVGLGERYLKIPTAEAEQENRRVSISRATALIGEVDE